MRWEMIGHGQADQGSLPEPFACRTRQARSFSFLRWHYFRPQLRTLNTNFSQAREVSVDTYFLQTPKNGNCLKPPRTTPPWQVIKPIMEVTGLPHEEVSALLELPFETRLHIYSHIIPSEVLEIDLCTIRRPVVDQISSIRRSGRSSRPAPTSSLVTKVLELENITRLNGLHLLSVSRQTRAEVLPLFSALTVRFHCTKCFEDLLANLSHGLGVGVASWMQHVEIHFDCGNGLALPGTNLVARITRGNTSSLARFMTNEAMESVQRTTWLYYGRLDLEGRETWKFRLAASQGAWDTGAKAERRLDGARPRTRPRIREPSPSPDASVPGRLRRESEILESIMYDQFQAIMPIEYQSHNEHREWIISGRFLI